MKKTALLFGLLALAMSPPTAWAQSETALRFGVNVEAKIEEWSEPEEAAAALQLGFDHFFKGRDRWRFGLGLQWNRAEYRGSQSWFDPYDFLSFLACARVRAELPFYAVGRLGWAVDVHDPDDGSMVYGLAAGFRFNERWAFELGYTDKGYIMGDGRYSSSQPGYTSFALSIVWSMFPEESTVRSDRGR